MNRQEMIEELKQHTVHIEFEKANGDVRLMLATLNPDIIPSTESTGESTRKPNENVITVWDTEKNDWRAFRLDRLRNFDGVSCPSGVQV